MLSECPLKLRQRIKVGARSRSTHSLISLIMLSPSKHEALQHVERDSAAFGAGAGVIHGTCQAPTSEATGFTTTLLSEAVPQVISESCEHFGEVLPAKTDTHMPATELELLGRHEHDAGVPHQVLAEGRCVVHHRHAG